MDVLQASIAEAEDSQLDNELAALCSNDDELDIGARPKTPLGTRPKTPLGGRPKTPLGERPKTPVSPVKELQDAKKKLEELRLLRFEEKTVLKQEIEQLTEKYGEGERNSNNMERQLKKCTADKVELDEKIFSLEKEISIGAQINTMQEQEITRLEMKLKDEEIQRYEVSKQLDLVRKAVLEKEQLRVKDVSQLLELRERITELDMSNTYYKTTLEENDKTMWEQDRANEELKDRLSQLDAQLKEERGKTEKLSLDVSEAELKVSQLQEQENKVTESLSKSQLDLVSERSNQETMEAEHSKRVTELQQLLETATLNELRYKDKCDQTEHLFRETLREKDSKVLELQRIADRVPVLEEQIGDLEKGNAGLQLQLNELRDVVGKRIRREDFVEQTEDTPNTSKDKTTDDDFITCEEIEMYFEETDAHVASLNEQISALSDKVEQEQAGAAALTSSLEGLKGELEKSESDLKLAGEQNVAASERKEVLEQNIESKSKENEHLRDLIKDCESQIDRLKTDLITTQKDLQKTSALKDMQIQEKEKVIQEKEEVIANREADIAKLNTEIKNLGDTIAEYESQVTSLKTDAIADKEEENRLQLFIQGLEDLLKDAHKEKDELEQKHEAETQKLRETVEEHVKAIMELQSDTERLDEEKEALGERLQHLESYSEKVSDMLEQNQASDDKIREKFINEINDYKTLVTDKDAEVADLLQKVETLNVSVREKNEYQEQIDKKLKDLANTQKKLTDENERIRKEKNELETRMAEGRHNLTTPSTTSTPVPMPDEVNNLHKRISEQMIIIEDLNLRISSNETDKNKLKKTISNLRSDIELKDSLISQLSHQHTEATSGETIAMLRSSVQNAEADKKHIQNKLNVSRHEKQMLEKTIRDQEEERVGFREQIANLQRLLARSEDAKEASMSTVAHFQHQLEGLRAVVDTPEEPTSKMTDLAVHVKSLRAELNLERLCRDRLEARYAKRHEEVNKLRTTLDKSLNTISKDTKNIENIIGKSLQKIDGINNTVTDSDDVPDTSENDDSLVVSAKAGVDKKYRGLPDSTNKSFDSLYDMKVGAASSTPRKSPKNVGTKPAPNSAPKRVSGSGPYIHEVPVRDLRSQR